ncbi:hypothetical protein EPIB1_2726 [Tritonibacter mobilis]|nr:hypothetical protein EPIB1_2726 [Tritonibacter mobilis]
MDPRAPGLWPGARPSPIPIWPTEGGSGQGAEPLSAPA